MRVARPHRMELRLSDAELRALEAAAGERGVRKADVLRAGIGGSANAATGSPRLSRERVLARLHEAAEAGSVNAMAALARELRLGGAPRSALPLGPVDLAEVRPAAWAEHELAV